MPGTPSEGAHAATSYQRGRSGWLLWIAALALIVRLGAVVATASWDQPLSDKVGRFDAIALSLLRGDGFARGGSPTAGTEPLYPLLLAAIYLVFGYSATAVRVVLALVDTAQCLLWAVIARQCLGPRSGWVTGGLLAICPYFVYLVVSAGSDTLFLALHAVFVLHLTRTLQTPSTGAWVATGAALGAATLCRAGSLAMPIFLLPFVLTAFWPRVRRAAVGATLLVVSFLVTLTPWTIRNAVVFHRLIPVQSRGGYHLLLSTGERLRAPGRRAAPQTDAVSYRRALGRIAQEPGAFGRGMVRRLGSMWTQTHSGRGRRLLAVANSSLLLLAAAGAVVARRRWRSLLPLYAVIGYFVCLHTFMFAIFRYLVPTVPALVTLASVPLLAISDRWLSIRGSRP